MRVYHGSYTKIDEIDLSKSEPKKDFGKGFYVTKYIEQAEFWAERKGKVNNTDACVTEFEFDEYAYKTKDLKILQFDNYTEEWFDFVVLNRQNEELAHDYDIVEGPVADDKINRKLQLFLDGEITREDFFEKLVHIPSHQICFCTFNSLQYLKTKNHKVIYKIEDITEKIVEKLIIDFGKSEKEASEIIFASTTFSQLADSTTQLYEKDWTEIYKLLLDELHI